MFMTEPIKNNLVATKRVLSYIKGMKSYEIMYEVEDDYKLT